jgi:hypothetical protein
MSPTARTLKWLRDHHIEAGIVERVVPHGYTKIDLFGGIDIVALPGHVLGIQATSGANHSHREVKASTNVKLARWIACGARYQVWSWRKSARTKRWVRRVSEARLVVEEYETHIKLEFTEKKEAE